MSRAVRSYLRNRGMPVRYPTAPRMIGHAVQYNTQRELLDDVARGPACLFTEQMLDVTALRELFSKNSVFP